MNRIRSLLITVLLTYSWSMAASNPALGGRLRHNAKLPVSSTLEPQFEYGLENCEDDGSGIICDYSFELINSVIGTDQTFLTIEPLVNRAIFGPFGNSMLSYYDFDVISFGDEVDAQYLINNTSDFILYNGFGTTMTILSDNGTLASSDLEFIIHDGAGGISTWNHLSSSELSLAVNIEGATMAEFTDTKLQVNGDVEITGMIKVKQWKIPPPDYVFKPGYELPTLNKVETYIKENNHLPEIPSAKEIETNGLDLATMNLKLLKKVEELTLYTIEQEKRIRKLEEKLNEK